MLLDVADSVVPPGSRLLGYAVDFPSDRLDFRRLLTEYCNRRSWLLDGIVTSECPSDFGGVEGEWPQVLQVVQRLSVTALITPSIAHLAPSPVSRHARIVALHRRDVAVRILPPAAVMTR